MVTGSSYYSLDDILQHEAQYYLIYGERSNGKTYSFLYNALKNWFTKGERFIYMRRYAFDFTKNRGQLLFNSIVDNGVVTELSGGKWDGVTYWNGQWFLSRFDDNLQKKVKSVDPIGYAMTLSGGEHDKGTSYSNVTTVCFDEAITRNKYLADEFVLFTQQVSTIARERDNVKFFLLGNTVSQYCPYFEEFGIADKIRDIEPGTIAEIRSKNEQNVTRIVVEYTDTFQRLVKKSNVYFAFDNPRLNMITSGAWETADYPHCPRKYNRDDVIFKYYIQFNHNSLECEVVSVDDMNFTFVHEQTRPIKDGEFIYSPEYNPDPYHRRKITNPQSSFEQRILNFYRDDKVFYSTNEVGEMMRVYLQWCGMNLT